MALAATLNPVQMHLLSVFSHEDSDDRLMEIKSILMNYYQDKLDKHLDNLWNSGVLNQARLDEVSKMDLHKDL